MFAVFHHVNACYGLDKTLAEGGRKTKQHGQRFTSMFFAVQLCITELSSYNSSSRDNRSGVELCGATSYEIFCFPPLTSKFPSGKRTLAPAVGA